LKYWSVALKFELAVGELEITKKNKLVNALLVAGLALIAILGITTLSLTLIELKSVLSSAKFSLKTTISFYLFILTLLLPSLFFLDAIRRMRRTKIQNSTISMKATFILSFAFLFEVVAGSLNLFEA
jgi:hypothetical protein